MKEGQTILQDALTLSRGFFVHVCGPDCVELRSGVLSGRKIEVDDPTDGHLGSIFMSFDGTRRVQEILQPWPEPVRVRLHDVITKLVRLNVLVPATADPWAVRLQGLKVYRTDEARTTVAGAKILVIGAGVVGSRVATNLVLSGIRRITLWDPVQLSDVDRRLCTAYTEAANGLTRLQALAAALSRLDPQGEVNEAAELRLEGYSLVVLALDYMDVGLSAQVNTLALRSRATWTLLACDGTQGFIGPTFLPGQTACLDCLAAYWLARSYTPGLAPDLVQLLPGETDGRSFAGLPGFADVVAGLFTADLPTILRRGDAFTLGRLLAIEFPTLAARRVSVARIPNCPSCGPEYPGPPAAAAAQTTLDDYGHGRET